MKKFLLLITLLSTIGSLFSQNKSTFVFESIQSVSEKLKATDANTNISIETEKNKNTSNKTTFGAGTIIWSEDLGNGFPVGWKINDVSGICPWVYSQDGSWGYYNGNSATKAGTAIKSTTASNGFLLSNPDSANYVNYGLPSETTYQYLETYITTSINYFLSAASEHVVINIYNSLGEKVDTYDEGAKLAGRYTLAINADHLSSGVYHYTLISGKNNITKKMTISK